MVDENGHYSFRRGAMTTRQTRPSGRIISDILRFLAFTGGISTGYGSLEIRISMGYVLFHDQEL
jgi:hypothetical protein